MADKYTKQLQLDKSLYGKQEKAYNDDKNLTEKEKNKKYGVCGKGKFVINSIERMGHNYDENGDPCKTCLLPPTFTDRQGYDTFKEDSKNKSFPGTYDEYDFMCNKKIETWFPAQNKADPYMNKSADKINWDSDEVLKQWITDRMDDDKLRCLVVGENCHGTGHKGLVKEYKDLHCTDKCTNLATTKQDIINSTTPTYKKPCKSIQRLKGYKLITASSDKAMNDAGKKAFKCGDIPNYIIPAQYEQWSLRQMRKQFKKDKETTVDFKDLGLSVSPPTTQFETCINDVFSNYDTSKEDEIIKKLHSKDKLSELSKDDLNYLERKLKAFLINSNQEKIKQCIKSDLYEDTTICHAELSEQMAKIIGVILFVIGYKFKDNDLNKPENKRVLLEMIDKFGDLIPRVFEKIILLTESIEKSECNGISDETKMLHNLYKKVFKSGTNVINFDLGISDMIKSATNQEFDRSTILMVLGIAFLKFF